MRKLLLLLFMASPFMVSAQGFQVNLAGQKQIGMGHTGTGLVQDGAAVFFNPGAVAMLPQNYVQAGTSPLLFKSVFNGTGTTNEYRTANKIATPFEGYAVYGPKSAPWKVGLGVYTPFGGLTDWGSNWQGKYVLESLNLKSIYFQPTLSYKITNYLSIGAGFVYDRGIVDLKRAIPLADANGQDGQAKLSGSGHGYGWNAGIFLKPLEKLSIGVSYRSKVTTTISKGDAIFTIPSSLQAMFPQPNTFYASIPLPATTSVGLGYYPNKQWTIAADASFVNWSVYKSLDFDYANNTSVLADTHSPRDYKNAVSLRGGAEYKGINNLSKWAIRAGGGYTSAAAQAGYVTPEVPDAKRYYLTAGLGYKAASHLDIDFSFEYEHLFSRTQTNMESNLSGTFKSNVYIPGISLAYHW
ncbi:long-chain fatty acid transporter [Mucilaginibacter robiniae]|uniref:Long-chain fatty acid transporter n=1 Tax=Mucilaginibacter robiniae TaxID=2728022 RepID=A0A7L5E582_9SPHI|nr:outer membrane protein transport protein [Mucilaginibacter robiniae]QJD96914.1 long-chain fatty acid transporter [Mucilaginibacter robiniae]